LQKETQAPAVLADVNYLRCLTEKSAAATVLPINLTEATVARWSDAVIAAAQQQRGEPAPEYCPVWIAACSLRALGFDMTYVWEQTTLWTPSESEAMGRLMPTLAQSKSTVAPGLLVLRTAVSTITTTWRPADGIACLAIEASTAETIFGKGRLSLLNYLPGRISGVLLEVNNADEIAKARASLDTLPSDFRTKPVAVAWPDKSPPTTTAMSGFRLVIAPSDPVDAWSKGFVTAGSASTPVQS
jgi:hypothetical protein